MRNANLKSQPRLLAGLLMGAFLLIGTPGAGNASPPATPTLSVRDNADGTGATATITGSTAGSSNAVDTVRIGTGGALVWTSHSRTGDGTLALPLANGQYLAIVSSSLAGANSPPSNAYQFAVTSPSAGGLTQAPTGNLGTALAGVAYLIASSPTFQAWVGAQNTAEALSHVAVETDDTEESGSTRPRAIVCPSPSGFELERVALQNFRPRITLDVSFEAAPSGAIEAETSREDRYWDEMLAFVNQLDGVLADCTAMEGIGTGAVAGQSQVSLSAIRLAGGPGAVEEIRAEGAQGEIASYFYAAVFQFTIHG